MSSPLGCVSVYRVCTWLVKGVKGSDRMPRKSVAMPSLDADDGWVGLLTCQGYAASSVGVVAMEHEAESMSLGFICQRMVIEMRL
jgi:hypothetical protein